MRWSGERERIDGNITDKPYKGYVGFWKFK